LGELALKRLKPPQRTASLLLLRMVDELPLMIVHTIFICNGAAKIIFNDEILLQIKTIG
jgi:hypothetical protein